MQEEWSQLEVLPNQFAQDIVSSVPISVDADYLTSQISEITYESQYGPDTLTLTMTDPDWVISTSGLCTRDSDGFWPRADINLPRGSDVWFRLFSVTGQGGTPTQANLQLIFIHRMVAYLMEDCGPLKAKVGTRTRAEFVKQLCDRIPGSLADLKPSVLGPGSAESHKINFVCPQLTDTNVTGSTATIPSTTKTVKSASATRNTAALATKGKGIGYGTSLTAKSQRLNNGQVDTVNAILDACESHNAPTEVMRAAIYAGIGESDLSYAGNTFGRTNQPSTTAPNQIEAWLTGGDDFTGHGGLVVGQQNPNWAYWQIANDVERNAVWDAAMTAGTTNSQAAADSYYRENGGSAFGGEAFAIVAAYGGASSATANTVGTSGSSSTASGSAGADPGQLERGTTSNPDEDSWTCITRLASQVNWLAYTSVGPPTARGNYLTYITGPRNDQQMPAAHIVRSTSNPGTWDLKASTKKTTMITPNALPQQPSFTGDNFAFINKTTRVVRGKVRQAAKFAIVKPQSATQVDIELVCNPMDFQAGQVIEFQNSGPLDGNWIISDNQRNILADQFDQITLDPPSQPTAAPTASSSSGSSSTASGGLSTGQTTSTGSSSARGGQPAGSVMGAYNAAKALSAKNLVYTKAVRNLGPLDSYPNGATWLDCSASVSEILYLAGFPLPGPAGQTPWSGSDWGSVCDSGPGQQMTLWTNLQHEFIEFNIPGVGHFQGNTVSGASGYRLFQWNSPQITGGWGGPSPGSSGAPSFTQFHYKGT